MKRVAQLDGIRGIAILLVLVWHYVTSHILVHGGSRPAVATGALLLTRSGVNLFFVLSGFLIGGLLLDHRESTNYFRVFYLRRACRILPLYFLMLASFVCARAIVPVTAPYYAWVFGEPFPLFSYATFTQNILMGIRGDFGPHWLSVTWSLAIEEQFYLFLPLLVYVLPRRILYFVLPAAILTAPLLRHCSPGLHAYVNAPWRADSLLSGVFLALLVRSRFFHDDTRRRNLVRIAWLVPLLGLITIANLTDVEFWLAELYTAFVLIAFVNPIPGLGRALRSPALVWFGQRSYGMYVFHEAVSGLCHGLIGHSAPQLSTMADGGVTVLAAAITLTLAELSWRYFENPILRFGHRFRYRREADLPLALDSA